MEFNKISRCTQPSRGNCESSGSQSTERVSMSLLLKLSTIHERRKHSIGDAPTRFSVFHSNSEAYEIDHPVDCAFGFYFRQQSQ